MGDKAARRLYGRVLLHDKLQADTLVTWLSCMSPEECEEVLVECAALIDHEEAAAREVWVKKVRAQATALRSGQFHSATVH